MHPHANRSLFKKHVEVTSGTSLENVVPGATKNLLKILPPNIGENFCGTLKTSILVTSVFALYAGQIRVLEKKSFRQKTIFMKFATKRQYHMSIYALLLTNNFHLKLKNFEKLTHFGKYFGNDELMEKII